MILLDHLCKPSLITRAFDRDVIKKCQRDAGFEDEGRSHGPWSVGDLLELEKKKKNGLFPRAEL